MQKHKTNSQDDLLRQSFIASRNEHLGVYELLEADLNIAKSAREDHLRKCIAENPQEGFFYLWLSLVLWWKGKTDEAFQEFETARNLGVSACRIVWYQSLCLYGFLTTTRTDSIKGTSLYDGAKKLVSAVLKAIPDFEGARVYQLYLNGYHSQLGQDVLVEDFFRFNKVSNGTFVDVGAFDGITLSNSRHLFELGWSGVCVEPVAENFKRLDALYAGTNVKCIQRAISLNEGIVNITNDGTGSTITDDTLANTERVVSCKLTSLLDELKIEEINFLSIDTEGTDFEVLQSLNFAGFQPQLIVIEYNANQRDRRRMLAFMQGNGYLLWHDNTQDLFFRAHATVDSPNFWNIKTLNPKRPNAIQVRYRL